MFKYSLYQSKANNASKGLWYPCIHYDEVVDTRALAEHMASHSTAHSPAQVEGVLCDMINCILELCNEGYSVKIPELGIFQYNIRGKGVTDKTKFDPKIHVVGLRMRVRGTGKMQRGRHWPEDLGVGFQLVTKDEIRRADVEKE